MKFVLGMVENIVRKGENAGYQHFHLFLQCFQKTFFQGRSKFGSCGKDLKKSILFVTKSSSSTF